MSIAARVKLGVNIDHVATLRQARRETEPDPVAAARVCRQAGADMIVTHLRRDRRHIQDKDLARLCALKGETHLEISFAPEMIAAALKARPSSVCLVPERPGEVSTEGGLDPSRHSREISKGVERLKKAGIEVSLFVDPSAKSVRAAKVLGADVVELCATAYSEARGASKRSSELERLGLAANLAQEMGLRLHAGHGLDYHNASAVAKIPGMECLNIGFSIVARAVFTGLRAAVAEMKSVIA